MRTPKYLSPSSIMMWRKDRYEFYRKYLADTKPPRIAQTEAMSVGSAFDAYIKNYLATCLGLVQAKASLDLEHLLTTQVEPQNMDFARAAGLVCFNAYKQLGACSELLKELEQASSEPRFEFTTQAECDLGTVVPLLGKPDLYFFTKSGKLCIYDWKVNGYCSAANTSPNKGYIRMLASGKPSACHKIASPLLVDGIIQDVNNTMDEINEDWALQLAIYSWTITGKSSGFIAGIDQLACGNGIRVASFRNGFSDKWLSGLRDEIVGIWTAIINKKIFEDDSVMEQLERDLTAFKPDGGSWEKAFIKMCR